MLGDKQPHGARGAWWRKEGRGTCRSGIETHHIVMIGALEQMHLAHTVYDLLVPLAFFFGIGLSMTLPSRVTPLGAVRAEKLRVG